LAEMPKGSSNSFIGVDKWLSCILFNKIGVAGNRAIPYRACALSLMLLFRGKLCFCEYLLGVTLCFLEYRKVG